MNADQLKGKWMQFKGDLKGKWGKFTDNALQEIAGNYDKFVGKVQEHMTKDSQLKNAGIKAQTNAGVVSLSGEVQDLMTSAQASWSAWQVPGVKSVKNDLTVKEKA